MSTHEVGSSDDLQQEIRIALIGSAGSGKSRIGNNILGENTCFRACTPTREVDKQSVHNLVVIDTPGYDNVDDDNVKKIRQNLHECIETSQSGVHVFLLCIKMDRFTSQTVELYKETASILGHDIYKHTILVFTHLDQWKSDMEETGFQNANVDTYLERLPLEMQEILRKCGDRYCTFDNRKIPIEMKKQCDDLLATILQLIEKNGRDNVYSEIPKSADTSDNRNWFLCWILNKWMKLVSMMNLKSNS